MFFDCRSIFSSPVIFYWRRTRRISSCNGSQSRPITSSLDHHAKREFCFTSVAARKCRKSPHPRPVRTSHGTDMVCCWHWSVRRTVRRFISGRRSTTDSPIKSWTLGTAAWSLGWTGAPPQIFWPLPILRVRINCFSIEYL